MKLIVNYNSRIYSKDAIESAIEAYAEVCHIDLENEGKYHKVIFGDFSGDKELLKKEFGNYVIGLLNDGRGM